MDGGFLLFSLILIRASFAGLAVQDGAEAAPENNIQSLGVLNEKIAHRLGGSSLFQRLR